MTPEALGLFAIAVAVWYHARTTQAIARSKIKHEYYQTLFGQILSIGTATAKSRIRRFKCGQSSKSENSSKR